MSSLYLAAGVSTLATLPAAREQPAGLDHTTAPGPPEDQRPYDEKQTMKQVLLPRSAAVACRWTQTGLTPSRPIRVHLSRACG